MLISLTSIEMIKNNRRLVNRRPVSNVVVVKFQRDCVSDSNVSAQIEECHFVVTAVMNR